MDEAIAFFMASTSASEIVGVFVAPAAGCGISTTPASSFLLGDFSWGSEPFGISATGFAASSFFTAGIAVADESEAVAGSSFLESGFSAFKTVAATESRGLTDFVVAAIETVSDATGNTTSGETLSDVNGFEIVSEVLEMVVAAEIRETEIVVGDEMIVDETVAAGIVAAGTVEIEIVDDGEQIELDASSIDVRTGAE